MSSRQFPHPLALLTAGIVVAAVLTAVVPAGEFDRRTDPATGRSVVVGGTYHPVPRHPVGLLGMLLAIPKGFADAASVIAVVFLVGGAFAVVDRTGALHAGLAALVGRLGSRANLAIPLCCVAFAAAGALENMQEEIIALVPVLVLLATRVGADRVTAVAMSVGAAAVGSAFSPVNPFQVGVAQQVAQVQLFSGSGLRTVLLVVALAVWIAGVMRHARRVGRADLTASAEATAVHRSFTQRRKVGPYEAGNGGRLDSPAGADRQVGPISVARTTVIIAIVLAAFAVFIVGLARLGWGFDELSAVFFAMGVAAGLIGGLGTNGTAAAFVAGFRDMAFAGLLIGFARGIYVTLSDGRIIDTVVNALFAPLAHLPAAVAALGMIAVQTVTHVAVPSVSGQAVLTLPVLVPLSDLLNISRQVTILAYQTGAGLCELLTPTNGALMAVLAAANVPYESWMRFAVPLWALLVALGAVGVLVAMAIGFA